MSAYSNPAVVCNAPTESGQRCMVIGREGFRQTDFDTLGMGRVFSW